MKTTHQLTVLYIEPVVLYYILVTAMEVLPKLAIGVQVMGLVMSSVLRMTLIIENYTLVNGTFQNSGDPTSGSTGTGAISISTANYGYDLVPIVRSNSSSTEGFKINFGQDSII